MSVEELRKGAAAGDSRAQFRLARALLIGREAPFSPDEALKLVRAACDQNDTQALRFHATLAALGFGRPQSWDDALAYVAKAADLGDPSARGQLAALGGLKGFDPKTWFKPSPVAQHCLAPRIYTAEGLLTKSACDWLIHQSKDRLTPARIKDPRSAQSAIDPIRNNSGAGFSMIEADLIVQLANLRIASAVGIPLNQHEPINVLHYAQGQQYRPHYDFITESEEAAFGAERRSYGQRICTVLVYLSDDYDGGETEFPRLNWRYKGKTGDALVFWNLSAQGAPERNSLHAGLPVTRGEKWLLSKWLREKPFPLH